jgi:hypothetical protein
MSVGLKSGGEGSWFQARDLIGWEFATMSKASVFQVSGFLLIAQGVTVLHPGKGGCADPVNEDAILERVGGRPPGRNRERQLASDTGDGKT